MKSERGKKYALIAAICYEIYAIYTIISFRNAAGFRFILWIALLGIAATLFMKNRKAVIVTVGLRALYEAYWLICNFFSLSFYILPLCNFVGYIAVIGLVVLALRERRVGKKVVKKLWFVPAAVVGLGQITVLLEDISHYIISRFGGWGAVPRVYAGNMFEFGVEFVALLFVGMWLRESASPTQVAPIATPASDSVSTL